MKTKNQKTIFAATGLLVAFVLWTMLVRWVDVQPIGPLQSCVGLAKLNRFVHDLLGVRMPLYVLTDWLGLVPIATAFAFALLGFVQWCRRKSLAKVDRSIRVLGLFYVAVIFIYAFFEIVPVNYRPVLIEGHLEASYPSSTTLLVLCVMSTAAIQLGNRIRHTLLRRCAVGAIIVFILFMVVGRLASGVHWITDIIGSILLSAGLVLLYDATSKS